VFLSDVMPEVTSLTTSSFYLYVRDVDAAYKRAVAAGATSKSEPKDEFWGDRHCVVVDPFGTKWSLATHVKELTDEQVNAAAAQHMKEHAAKKPGAA